MPTYVYACEICNSEVELHRSVDTRKPAPACPCGAEMALKVSAPSAVIFRGGGFHATDYKAAK